MALALPSAIWPNGLVPTSELVTRVLGVALAFVEKCTLPVAVGVLLPVVTESPAAVTLAV